MTKIDMSHINELCLPLGKRPKKIIGARVVVLKDLRNKAGDMIECGTVAYIYQSFYGYGIKAPRVDGTMRAITRVSHYSVRFLKEGLQLQ